MAAPLSLPLGFGWGRENIPCGCEIPCRVGGSAPSVGMEKVSLRGAPLQLSLQG